MRHFGFLLLWSLMATALPAQATWEVGLSGGYTAYAGDLNEEKIFDLQNRDIGYSLFLRRHFGPVFALRLNYLGGKIAGDESHFTEPHWRAERAFSFSTNFHETSLLLEWDIFGRRRRNGWRFRKIFAPYLFAGAGYNFYKPNTNYNDFPELNPSVSPDRILADKTAKTNEPALILNLGGGIKWDIGRYWLLNFELGIRPAWTDRLDGVEVSGTSGNRDWYAFASIGLSHRIREPDSDRDWIPNRRDRCPLAPGYRAMKGCPDADGDKITDAEDDCPTIPGQLSARGCPDEDADGTQDSLDLCLGLPGLIDQCGCPDRDSDGVPDLEDACPDQPGVGLLAGCPDRDGDGLADHEDYCPDLGGRITPFGCPDTDGDGIEDLVDACPELPGSMLFLGCPDTDGDGVEDALDTCPNVGGLLRFNGCPDTDGDGIEDAKDACPQEKGLAEFLGCPDTDGDGLPDRDDKCPKVAGAKSENGCPELKKADRKIIIAAVRDIQFETGSDKLTEKSNPVLERLAGILNNFPNYKVRIAGHTDSQGAAVKNQNLSERRAASCVTKLIELGIEADRLESKGFGESKPVASNKTAKGRAKNRRVEFELDRMF